MPVQKSEQSAGERQSESQDLATRQDNIAEEIVDAMDLSLEGGKVEDPKEPVEEKRKIPEPEEEEEEETEEEESEGEEDDEEEEVVSKSKFQKRLNTETAKRKVLEAKLEELQSRQEEDSGSTKSKLDKMSSGELKSLKSKARKELREVVRAGDNAQREDDLEDFIDDVDDAIRTAPQKFQKSQIAAYDRMVNKVMSDPSNEKIDFETDGEAIKTVAAEIYSKYPDLQKLEKGQATALEMAVDHFKQVSQSSKGKSKERQLKQENNKLKRKTALDTGSKHGRPSKTDLKKKRNDLRGSTNLAQKEALMMDHINVDAYLPKSLR